jgi:hypothetical protein
MNTEKKPIFIISQKYYRGYQSYLKHYVDNILNFYGNKCKIIIVDNNSTYPQDVWDNLPKNDNIIFLINDIECKFELGAYQVGIKYVIDNNLINEYDYFVCTQDNFIIKNKVDFNALYDSKVYACPINSYYQDGECKDVCDMVLNKLNMNNNLDKITFCWCSSFVVYKTKLEQLYGYLKNIIITVRWESCDSERYLARILWELNEYKNDDIDGDIRTLKDRHYYCWTVDPLMPSTSFFVKRVQQKNENTKDLI